SRFMSRRLPPSVATHSTRLPAMAISVMPCTALPAHEAFAVYTWEAGPGAVQTTAWSQPPELRTAIATRGPSAPIAVTVPGTLNVAVEPPAAWARPDTTAN